MISLLGVEKTYQRGANQVHALRGLDLEIASSEFTIIMGPSGSGKSTLLHLVGCLDTPSAGQILFEGTDLVQLSSTQRAEFRRRRIGFIFQRFNQIPNLSAQENVELPLLLSGAPRRQAHEQARSALRQVGLAERSSHRPSELSGGELQRVTVARALVNNPDAILADEPTGNLDMETGDQVISMLRHLKDEGRACIVVTHNPELAIPGDSLVYVRDGKRVDSLFREEKGRH
ncbi:MAG: ABC transporter ATP-binding protein [Candidatus Atribacteria bacterium]|nr:MAG: ABC transporter ATP-binding protein [Candidatus Atribacteria bacterium]